MPTSYYPMLLEPRFDAKIWGGRKLETVLGKTLPSDERYGESLESDAVSRISNGSLAGRTIQELIDQDAGSLLGVRGIEASQPFGDFPLLAKFIDASDVLSVQVHPNDDEASPQRKRGKTESWHVIAAEPDAKLITGLRDGVTSDDVRQAIEDVRLGELVIEQPVQAGDTLLIPAGTTHAIGAGILLYEIQQASDITYRMYDWGRVDDNGNPRDLHVDESISVLKPELQARLVTPLALAHGRSMLTACRYFALERWELNDDPLSINHDGQSFRLVSCLEGEAVLDASEDPVKLPAGRTALIPAAMQQFTVSGHGTLLVSYVPDLRSDVIESLRAAGHGEDAIAALAGDLQDLATG